MFNSLGNQFSSILKKLSFKSGKITEDDLDQTIREIRIALLESDVNLKVASAMINLIRQKSLGEKVIQNVSAVEMIMKNSHEALKEILGGDHEFQIGNDEKIMLVGLQGAGKTTTAAKLANFIKNNKKKSVILSSLDYYRPAAREQLKVLSQKNDLDYYDYTSERDQKNAVIETAKEQLKFLKEKHYQCAIFDTAGRTSINEEMMQELIEVKTLINPTKIILVVDAMIGKTAIEIAKHFHENLELTGIIFTKTDSDTKAGAILSIRHLLNLPIYFLCSGEKINDLDEFHAERIAQRILGMGDIASLVEKASSIIPNDNSDALKEKAKKGELDLFDVLDQFRFLKKMGGLPFISKFLPTEVVNNANISEKKIKQFEAIILSMTKKERLNPSIVMQSGSRKRRIAKGSGSSILLIDELITMHGRISKMAQQFAMFDKGSIMDKFKMGQAMSDVVRK
jgi:signal recognition particle subunit SRP54